MMAENMMDHREGSTASREGRDQHKDLSGLVEACRRSHKATAGFE
jgi:hypothetical protein